MFRAPNSKVPRAKAETGRFTPIGVPYKGLDARSPFASMDPNAAISLNNVLVESFGLRTRKGYTEWAVDLPEADPVYSVMNYYPASTGEVIPTKLYATWNPDDKSANVTLTNSNLTATQTTGTGIVRATMGKSSGKWYWEGVCGAGGARVGVTTGDTSLDESYLGAALHDWSYYFGGLIYNNGTSPATVASYSSADVLGFALDMDVGTLTFYKNNVNVYVASGLSGTFFPANGDNASGESITMNFGASPLTYAPPVGFHSGLYNVVTMAEKLRYTEISSTMFVQPRSTAGPGPGIIFAAQNDSVYNVTAGGSGPWTPEAGITGATAFWNGVNYQNVAGNFYLAANEGGGYAIYNGTSWTMPVAGSGPQDINGLDPSLIVWVTTWKERVWFLKKGSTVAYYLPPGQLTGTVTAFDFGTQMDHGGYASWLGGWTVDGGSGTDDYLVCCGSQGDVVIYKGIDPDDATTFSLHGVWYSGPLPTGHRCVEGAGGDIEILTMFGVMPLSKLLQPTHLAAQFQQHLSMNVDPLIAALMRDYSDLPGWQCTAIAKEALVLIRIPELVSTVIAKSWLAYKTTTQSWSVLSDLPYAHIINAGPVSYAGTLDGRVVRAFDGPLDNVKLGESKGTGIACRVTPAYNDLGAKGMNKKMEMVRPFFLCTVKPVIQFTVLTNYNTPDLAITPSLPADLLTGKWDEGKWDEARWGGLLQPIHSWFGAAGFGHTMTVQFDYVTGGETLLTNLDYWTTDGGVM